MNFLWSESFAQNASFSLREDILIQKIVYTHDPDGRVLDSELCLRAAEAIMRNAPASQMARPEPDCTEMGSIQVDGSEEPLGHTIYRLSREIMSCLRNVDEDMCTKPLALFDLLGKYRWDAKLSLVLSAFAVIYGELWVILQSQHCNRLASAISLLKDMSFSSDKFKLVYDAITLLFNSMVALTRLVVLFERLPIVEAELDDGRISTTKPLVYVAAYWIFRSVLICTSKLHLTRASKDLSQLLLADVVWELTSLEHRIRSISDEMKLQVTNCQMEVEQKIHQKLLQLLSETQDDNQKILRMLLSLKDDTPLKHSFQVKVGITELAEKVVLLLVSKPELLPTDELLLLVQQIYDKPKEEYEIVWIPIPPSEDWRDNDMIVYNLLSSSLPWYSVRKPWSLSPTTISLVKKEWNFKDHPIIVALDPGGNVRNLNAIDMGWIWGARAFPFSTSREEELWEKEKSTLKLLVDGVSPLLCMWAEEEERVICIYGSDSADWTSEFIVKMKQVQISFDQLKVVYVGKKPPDKKVRKILASINKVGLGSCLTWNRMQLFWIRLESMRRSKLKLGKSCNSDHILREVEDLMGTSESESGSGWMIVGQLSSTDTLQLRGQEVIRALSLFPVLRQNCMPELGLVDAMRACLKAPPGRRPCKHPRIIIKYDEATKESLICDNCGRLMEKFIVFDRAQATNLPVSTNI